MALQEKAIACGPSLTVLGMVLRFIVGPAVTTLGAVAMGLRGNVLRLAMIQVCAQISWNCLLCLHVLLEANLKISSKLLNFVKNVIYMVDRINNFIVKGGNYDHSFLNKG
jgi:Membrane transport protein